MTLASALVSNPTLFLGFVALLGLLVGSFINVIVYRLPIMLERAWQSSELPNELPTEAFNLAVPRSHCPSCAQQLSASENVPVVSFLFLRGRCRHCKSRISARYPLVEIAASVASILVAMTFGFTASTLAFLAFAWFLLALSLIDLDHHLLPDDLTLPLLWLGLLVSAFNLGLPGVSLFDAVIGAAAGYITLWSLFWAFLLVTGKEGLGYGDFKLLAALGAWLGWQAILPVLLLASLAGAAIGLILIVFGGRERSAPLPFGPFLAAAGFVMLIWGPQVLALYGTLFAPH
ncbi:MAG: A24 family peptidase [OM182 bacterium]|jgi:leader peptidase (prepilin peptidase)/N-methyltransferase|tara:strand:- start:6643 stop:7509 length:867 start_codon:yes stop_codon:yes gene_type:complete